jgi:hypothetical protein
MFELEQLEAMLVAAARAGETMTYAQVMRHYGLEFARWRVRHLCAALDAVDELQRGKGRPELAVLVVRGDDGLPGQGWWLSKHPAQAEWDGAFTGPAAELYVQRIQRELFGWWREHDRG